MKELKTSALSTPDKLLYAGIKLFAKYGLDSTTTRMIAKEANVTLSAISFHFSNKEVLYSECLKFIAKKAEAYYNENFTLIQNDICFNTITPASAYYYICELIDLQINVAFKPQYKTTLQLIYWEQVHSLIDYSPITKVVFERIERLLANLISILADMPMENAIISSRFINGSIISFGEHKLLVQNSLNINTNFEETPEWVQNELNKNCKIFLNSIIRKKQ